MSGMGVDITETAVRFAKLRVAGGECRLEDHGEYPLSPGSFSEGKIVDLEALRTVLSRLKTDHHASFVYASLPEPQAYLVEMEVASVKKSQLRESIELQIEEYIPLSVTEAVFDYNIIEDQKGNKEKTKVLVSVAPKDLVSSYSEVFTKAGLQLISFETDAQALARAVVPLENEDTFMIVHFGPEKTGIYITRSGLVQFSSDIDVGAKELVGSIHGEDQNICTKLKDEIDKHFAYWNMHKSKTEEVHDSISKILLCGENAGEEGLQAFLSKGLRAQVEVANVWTNILSFDRDIPQMNFQESLKYATAIGLAINAKIL